MPEFLQILPYVHFPLTDSAIHPYCVKIINHILEYSYVLNPVTPFSKTLNKGMVLGLPKQTSTYMFKKLQQRQAG